MLEFFGKRLRYIQEVKREERGFTLIELLVVVIIIGILAAIAIPAFLSQRQRAQNGAAQSDLRNAAAAATSCFSKNNGSYTTPTACTEANLASQFGFRETTGVDVVVGTPTNDVWTATAKHASGDTTYEYSTATGKVQPQAAAT